MLGVIVRSVGERTEKLAVAAARTGCNTVFNVRNVSPLTNSIFAMYNVMLRYPRAWYLCVDGDTILLPGWRATVSKFITKEGLQNHHILGFACYDPLLGRQFGWMKCYNMKYIPMFREALIKNHAALHLKMRVDDNLRHIIERKINKKPHLVRRVTAIHGAEQYYHSTFYRFAVLATRRRKAKLPLKHGKKCYCARCNYTIKPNSHERRLALKGWDYGMKHDCQEDFNTYKRLKKERPPLEMSLGQFWEKYKR